MHTVEVTRDGDEAREACPEPAAASREPCGRDGCRAGALCARCRAPVSGSAPRPRQRTGRRVRPERVFRDGSSESSGVTVGRSPRAPVAPAPPPVVDAPETRRAHPSLIRALLEERTPGQVGQAAPRRRSPPRQAVEGLAASSVAPLAEDARRPARSGSLGPRPTAAGEGAGSPAPVPGLNPRAGRDRRREGSAPALTRVPTLTSPRPKPPELELPDALEVPRAAPSQESPPRAGGSPASTSSPPAPWAPSPPRSSGMVAEGAASSPVAAAPATPAVRSAEAVASSRAATAPELAAASALASEAASTAPATWSPGAAWVVAALFIGAGLAGVALILF